MDPITLAISSVLAAASQAAQALAASSATNTASASTGPTAAPKVGGVTNIPSLMSSASGLATGIGSLGGMIAALTGRKNTLAPRLRVYAGPSQARYRSPYTPQDLADWLWEELMRGGYYG